MKYFQFSDLKGIVAGKVFLPVNIFRTRKAITKFKKITYSTSTTIPHQEIKVEFISKARPQITFTPYTSICTWSRSNLDFFIPGRINQCIQEGLAVDNVSDRGG